MISLDTFKKSLGEAGNNYSEREIEKILSKFQELADAGFDWWLNQTKQGVASGGGVIKVYKENGDAVSVTVFAYSYVRIYATI